MHEVNKADGGVERVTTTAGKLQNMLSSDLAIKLILIGKINGTDIKYMRKLITERHLASIDLTDAQIVTGGVAYYQNNKITANNVMGDYAFQGFAKLVNIKLPQTLIKVGFNAFSSSGLKTIEIPDKVTNIDEDAFAYCDHLATVIIGKGAKSLAKGAFYESKVKDVYVKALTPPTVSSYLFSSKPTIHVYASALAKYKASGWAEYGTIVGDLDKWEQTTSLSEEIRLKTEESSTAGAWYDISGRKVNPQSKKGLYIENRGNSIRKGRFWLSKMPVFV